MSVPGLTDVVNDVVPMEHLEINQYWLYLDALAAEVRDTPYSAAVCKQRVLQKHPEWRKPRKKGAL